MQKQLDGAVCGEQLFEDRTHSLPVYHSFSSLYWDFYSVMRLNIERKHGEFAVPRFDGESCAVDSE